MVFVSVGADRKGKKKKNSGDFSILPAWSGAKKHPQKTKFGQRHQTSLSESGPSGVIDNSIGSICDLGWQPCSSKSGEDLIIILYAFYLIGSYTGNNIRGRSTMADRFSQTGKHDPIRI
jgi:hypothetical protein